MRRDFREHWREDWDTPGDASIIFIPAFLVAVAFCIVMAVVQWATS